MLSKHFKSQPGLNFLFFAAVLLSILMGLVLQTLFAETKSPSGEASGWSQSFLEKSTTSRKRVRTDQNRSSIPFKRAPTNKTVLVQQSQSKSAKPVKRTVTEDLSYDILNTRLRLDSEDTAIELANTQLIAEAWAVNPQNLPMAVNAQQYAVHKSEELSEKVSATQRSEHELLFVEELP